AQLAIETITYRHAGPGPASVALVAIPGKAGRAALERLLGKPVTSYVSDAPAPEPVPAVAVVVDKLLPWQMPATRPAAPAVSVVIPGVTFTVVSRMQFAPVPVSATVGPEMFTDHQNNTRIGKGAAL
ncbi:hypothetical protein ACFQY5_41340, partial [Paeniroseomonas aquatica]